MSYRVGFEDACDVIFGMVSANRTASKLVKEEILAFILQVRQAKAEGILADLEIYRAPVRVLIASASKSSPISGSSRSR